MPETDWLYVTIKAIHTDIHELKSDVRKLTEWRWKLAGAVAVVNVIVVTLFETYFHK